MASCGIGQGGLDRKTATGFATRDETRICDTVNDLTPQRELFRNLTPGVFPLFLFPFLAGYDHKPPSRPYDGMSNGGGSGGFAPLPFDGAGGGKDKPVDERVQHERPCRTLFVRNVSVSVSAPRKHVDTLRLMSTSCCVYCVRQYDADSSKIKADFERYGDIKTFFDIINNRGMAFITYVRLATKRFFSLC